MFESLPFFLSKLRCFTAFVNNTECFPKPLTKEKERELLIKYRQEGDMQARSQLINHNLRLVSHIVKKDLLRPSTALTMKKGLGLRPMRQSASTMKS